MLERMVILALEREIQVVSVENSAYEIRFGALEEKWLHLLEKISKIGPNEYKNYLSVKFKFK